MGIFLDSVTRRSEQLRLFGALSALSLAGGFISGPLLFKELDSLSLKNLQLKAHD